MICCVTGPRPKGFPFAYGFSNEICKDTAIPTSFEAYKARLEKEVERLIPKPTHPNPPQRTCFGAFSRFGFAIFVYYFSLQRLKIPQNPFL